MLNRLNVVVTSSYRDFGSAAGSGTIILRLWVFHVTGKKRYSPEERVVKLLYQIPTELVPTLATLIL